MKPPYVFFIIEDNLTSLENLAEELRDLGQIVHPFTNVKDALKFVAEVMPDVILADNDDDNGEQDAGVTFCLEMKKKNKGVTTVVMSGRASAKVASALVDKKIDGFCPKPFVPEKMLKTFFDKVFIKPLKIN